MSHKLNRWLAALACPLLLIAAGTPRLHAQASPATTATQSSVDDAPERDAAFQKFILDLAVREANTTATAARPGATPVPVRLQDRLTKNQGLDLPLALKAGESFKVAFRKSVANDASTPPVRGRAFFHAEVKVLTAFRDMYQIEWRDVMPAEAIGIPMVKEVKELPALVLRVDRMGNIQWIENEREIGAFARKINERLSQAKPVAEQKMPEKALDPAMMKAVLLNQALVYFAVHARTFWPDKATRENLRQPMPMMGAVTSAQLENKVESWDETNSRLGVRFTMAFDMKLNTSPQTGQPGVMTLRRSFAYLLNLARGVTEKGSQELVGTLDGKVVQRERLDFVTVGRE